MAKLTLSVDEQVVARAKRYAQERGTSVSGLVEQMLDLATAGAGPHSSSLPVLSRLRGALKGVHEGDYKRYLEKKYR